MPFLRLETATPSETEQTIMELRERVERREREIEELRASLPRLKQLEKRMARYEAFTKKFMEMTPEELEEIGKVVERKRQKRILKENRETYAAERARES